MNIISTWRLPGHSGSQNIRRGDENHVHLAFLHHRRRRIICEEGILNASESIGDGASDGGASVGAKDLENLEEVEPEQVEVEVEPEQAEVDEVEAVLAPPEPAELALVPPRPTPRHGEALGVARGRAEARGLVFLARPCSKARDATCRHANRH